MICLERLLYGGLRQSVQHPTLSDTYTDIAITPPPSYWTQRADLSNNDCQRGREGGEEIAVLDSVNGRDMEPVNVKKQNSEGLHVCVRG